MATPKWKRRAKRLGIFVLAALLVYAVLGFMLIPALVRYVGLSKLNDQVAGYAKVEQIKFNPFTFTLKLKNFRGYTPDENEVIHFDEFVLNVQATSLMGDTIRIREITLDGPYLNLIIDQDGKPNIASALGKLQDEVSNIQEEAAKAQAESDDPFVIPGLRIDAFHVVNASLRTEINSLSRPFVREFKKISFTMDDVHTIAEHDNPYDFALETAQGEQFQVSGNLRLDPLSTIGSLRIAELQLEDFLAFAGDQVGFEMEGGALNFSINYAFVPLGESPRLDLTEGRFRLTDFALLEMGQSEPFQTISRLELDGLGVDVLHDRITLDAFQLEGAMLRVVRDRDGLLNLIRYITPPERQAEIASEARQEAAAEAASREIRLGVVSGDQDLGVALTSAWNQVQKLVELKWDLAARRVSIRDVDLIWRDEFLTEPAELRWTNISLTASSLSNGDQPFPYDLSLLMNETGHIELHGMFTATPANSKFEMSLTELPLTAIAPYVDPLAPVRLQSGVLSATGQSEIAFPDDGLPELGATLDASLADFALQWDNGDPLVAWQKLEVAGVNATTQPMSVLASEMKLVSPVLHAERQADGSLRLPQPEPTPPTQKNEQSAPPTPPAKGETTPFSVQLHELIVEDGQVHVRDDAVSPAAKFALEKIDFQAAPIAYPDIQPMTFSLEYGFAEGPSGMISVSGALDPMRPLAATEFEVSTRGVTLAPFAPYAVSVIGRPPTDGRLNASLGYSITNGAIDGKNKMQIKTVRFGERPADSQAPELPLELGVAILEDSNGVMHIDIPVAGDADDPEFSLDQMISYAIENMLEKLAAAPFAAIGALGDLIPGNEETGKYIPFEAGSAEVEMDMLPVLEQMASELGTRPALVTTLTPSIDPEADADGLRGAKLDAMLKAKMTEQGSDEATATASLYQALPESGEATTLEDQQAAIKQSIDITDVELAALAQQRAEAVRQELLTAGLSANSVTILAEPAYATEGARVLLGAEAAESKLTQEVSLAPGENS